jgi:hypothetical protein
MDEHADKIRQIVRQKKIPAKWFQRQACFLLPFPLETSCKPENRDVF